MYQIKNKDMKILCTIFLISFGFNFAFSQNINLINEPIENKPYYKYSIYTTWLTFSNFGNPETNTHHYELRFGYQITPKNQLAVKFATWKLFAPLGIDIWDSKLLDREYFYPGRLKETGFGVTYQRKIWKGLFTTLEIMPLFTEYIDTNGQTIGKGFKLYNSYHVGYHIPLFRKGRFYIEPQIHVNHWPINNNVPDSFMAEEIKYDNYFLIEPNIYFGIKF